MEWMSREKDGDGILKVMLVNDEKIQQSITNSNECYKFIVHYAKSAVVYTLKLKSKVVCLV